jgi:hypothetical protein
MKLLYINTGSYPPIAAHAIVYIIPKAILKPGTVFDQVITQDDNWIILTAILKNEFALIDQIDIYHLDGFRNSTRFCIGKWDCNESPYTVCVYDHLNDPGHDNCLICHEPEERK